MGARNPAISRLPLTLSRHVAVVGECLRNLYHETCATHILVPPGQSSGDCPYLERLDRVLDAYLLWAGPAVSRRQRLGLLGVEPTLLAPVVRLLDEARLPEAGLDLELCRRSLGRPGVRPDLEQLPCMLACTQERARLMTEFGGPSLLLGDDDLVSVALSRPVDVVDMDTALLTFLEQTCPHAHLIEHDLTQGLPGSLGGRYAVVATDPPYAWEGFRQFLDCARAALAPGGVLMLSTNLDMVHGANPLEGFRVLEHHRGFNRYPMPEDMRRDDLVQAERAEVPAELAQALYATLPYHYADLYLLSPVASPSTSFSISASARTSGGIT